MLDPNLPFSGTAMVRFTARKINVLTYCPMDDQGMQLSTVKKKSMALSFLYSGLEKVASVTFRQRPRKVI